MSAAGITPSRLSLLLGVGALVAGASWWLSRENPVAVASREAAENSSVHRPLTHEDSLRRAVAQLIDQALQPDLERQSFAALEALGCRAVPALIRRLDDRRPLPVRGISFRNTSPGAFEGLRHYSPELMVDALAALLNQLTGRDFGFIYNGASDAERDRAVQGWREYLQRVGPAGTCPAAG